MSISVIVPTYNEASFILRNLAALCEVRGSFEVIVADGSSTDGTRLRVEELIRCFPHRLRLITTERNRAVQLNRAAEIACGEALLFLHTDALLPADALEALETALAVNDVVGGNFRLRFESDSPWSAFFTWVNRVRRPFGIYYGDSAVFVRRRVFECLSGFKPIPIMEDYEFIRRLERYGRTICLPPVVTVSDRRWRCQGALRTMWSWFWIQFLYSLGVSPQRLAHWYKPVRQNYQDPERL